MTASRLIPSLAAAVLGGGLLCGSCRSAPENFAAPAMEMKPAPGEANFLLPLNGELKLLGLRLQAGEAFALKIQWQAESRVCGPGQTEFASFSGLEIQVSRAGSLPEIKESHCQKLSTFVEHRCDTKGDCQQLSICRYRCEFSLADGRSGTIDFSVSIGSSGLVEVEVLRR